jgi:outer membrane protein OmpA-like peptidoglycan-associated protein
MRLAKTILLALPLMLLITAAVSAQETEREKRRITNPTVTGATGLFTVYDASTLKRGEFNFGIFANNYDRDPGDVDIMQYPVNFAVGATNRLEFFVNSDTYQRLISESPFELSGPIFPGLSQPQGTFSFQPVLGSESDAAGFFPLRGAPLSGALVGGILPGLPQTGIQPVFDSALGRFKPGFFIPGYLNDFPFLGRGGGTTGNVTFGAKVRLNSQDKSIGYAVLGLIRVPTVLGNALRLKERGGRLTMGSGAGAIDYGAFLIISPRFGIVSTHINVGYMHSGDTSTQNNELIDRNDSLIFAGGIDIPFSQYAQIIGEATYNLYVGSQTPNLNQVNPLDLVVGARFYPFGKNEDRRFLFSLGGGYRYFANNAGEEREASRFLIGGRNPDPDYNGFVAHITLGLRRGAPKPPPPVVEPCANNRPPTVTLTADKMAVKQRSNETVTFTASAMDADNDNLTYKWTASSGQLTGTGNQMTWSSANLAPGDYRISVTVTDVCNNSASDSRTVTVERVNNCPTVAIRANPTSVQEGSDQPFTFSAAGNDPDGDTLQYTWTTTRGTLSGGDTEKRLDTTGLAAGSITVKVTVTDGQCPATDSVTVNITPRPAPPPVFSTSCSTYKTANDTRPDNACKRVLDDVAARLQADPTATVILDGHSDKGEKAGTAKRRAERVRDYLVNERRVDANRVEVRSFDNTRPHESGDRKLNRRVVIHVVPQGATRPQ